MIEASEGPTTGMAVAQRRERQPREGWASFGKEANKFDEVADVD